MYLQKAIEINTDLVRDQPTFSPDDRREAVMLGIEALKRTICRRERLSFKFEPLLPGETIDQFDKGQDLLCKGAKLLAEGKELLNVDTR